MVCFLSSLVHAAKLQSFFEIASKNELLFDYDKMTDDDKNMLPLKWISFLGNNE